MPILDTLSKPFKTAANTVVEAFTGQPNINQPVIQNSIPAITTPQASTIETPTKIPNETLTYKAPTQTGIEQPISANNESMNALSGAIMTTPQAPVTPPTDRELAIKDRQTAIDQYLNPETGYSATSLKLQQEQGLPEKQQQLDALTVKDIALQKQLQDYENNLLNKNQQGLFGGAGQQAISQYQRDISSQRAELAIQKLALQGDIKGATDLINLKLNATFEPVKQRIDYLDKTLTIYGNDLSESDKVKLENEKYQLQQTIKSKDDFQKILDDAQMAGASVDEIKQASDLFTKGDRTGALNSIAKYSSKSSLTPAQINSTVTSIAGAFDNEPIVKNFNVIAEGKAFVDKIPNKTNNPADDQALIYSLAKALDPNSVVREGEYATAQKYTQSWIKAYGKSVEQAFLGNGFLSQEARKNIKDTINKRYEASKVNYDNVKAQYQRQIDDAYRGSPRTITDYAQGTNQPTPTGTRTITVKGKTLPVDF